ncbi:hypothetical protein J4220_00940 [Candidatus Micrarchaeota archaeon]|nr:hypothetical protein [Candidatus Micrarchaeota archaeon]
MNERRGKRAQNWTPIYMLIVIIIAVILLVTFVKPLFNQASETASQTSVTTRDALNSIAIAFS